MSFGKATETFSNPFKVSLQRSLTMPALLTVLNFRCVIAGSKDDLGDFSKDSLQEALGNANLLHERGDYLYLSPLLWLLFSPARQLCVGFLKHIGSLLLAASTTVHCSQQTKRTGKRF